MLSIVSRTVYGKGCPYCSRSKAKLGKDSLEAVAPDIASEWHPFLNTQKPSEVLAGTGGKYWWRCSKCGHEWLASVYNRVSHNCGCPKCAHTRLLPGVNDLATVDPDVAAEWHPTKNALRPNEVTAHSNKKYWWLCPKCGHEWLASNSNRVTCHSGCPKCKIKQAIERGLKTRIARNGSIAELCPKLLEEWDFEKNKDIADPNKVSLGSQLRVGWICKKCGNKWEARISSRTSERGCPVCGKKAMKETMLIAKAQKAGRSILQYIDSVCQEKSIVLQKDKQGKQITFASEFPDLVHEWDYDHNKYLPTDYSPTAPLYVFWRCPNGHFYYRTIVQRTKHNKGCPYCKIEDLKKNKDLHPENK